MSQLQNTNPNITKEEFRQYVKEYLGLSQEISKIMGLVKELKTKKTNIENIVKGGMIKFNCEEISFKDGSCMTKTSRTKTNPLNIKWVSTRLNDLFQDKTEDEIKEIADYICNIKYRKTSEVVEGVKLTKPKKKRVKK